MITATAATILVTYTPEKATQRHRKRQLKRERNRRRR